NADRCGEYGMLRDSRVPDDVLYLGSRRLSYQTVQLAVDRSFDRRFPVKKAAKRDHDNEHRSDGKNGIISQGRAQFHDLVVDKAGKRTLEQTNAHLQNI